jgi:hypothetical protein
MLRESDRTPSPNPQSMPGRTGFPKPEGRLRHTLKDEGESSDQRRHVLSILTTLQGNFLHDCSGTGFQDLSGLKSSIF